MAALTIPDEATYVVFQVGSGGQTTFPISFSLFSKADIQMSVSGVLLSQADFTFAGNPVDGGFAGGLVTLNSTAFSAQVVIWRETEIGRTTNFAPAQFVNVSDIDAALNRLEAKVQENRRDISAAIRVPVGEDITVLDPVSARANKYAFFDADGNLSAISAGANPSGLAPFTDLSANAALNWGGRYWCDSSGGAITLTLPDLATSVDKSTMELWTGDSAALHAITLQVLGGSDQLMAQGQVGTTVTFSVNAAGLLIRKLNGLARILPLTPGLF